MSYRSREEAEEMIEEMRSRSKGKYITQGVSFNKDCPRQMELLRSALMNSASFSGLMKELLVKINSRSNENMSFYVESVKEKVIEEENKRKRNIGNFL